jgi:hypothetical protein
MGLACVLNELIEDTNGCNGTEREQAGLVQGQTGK